MSWHRIVLPFTTEIDPTVVEIGKLAWERYLQEGKPVGFGMFHATEANAAREEFWVIYLTPVAASVCSEIGKTYKAEPCDVPARDEPIMAYVFGDPRTMSLLQESYEAKLAAQAAATAPANAAANSAA